METALFRQLRWVWTMVALVAVVAAVLLGTTGDRLFAGPLSTHMEGLAYPSPALSLPFRVFVPLIAQEAVSAKPGWRLVFDDEFQDTQLEANKWHTQYWWGRTNPPEAQYYAPDAFGFESGTLRIRAEQRQMDGYAYTAGLAASCNIFDFTYGYVETRVKVPKGQGLWPAFWLLAKSNPLSRSEIDVMEILGNEPQRVYTTLHYDDALGQHKQTGSSFSGPDFSQDFHTFAVDWSPAALIWYVDGIERFRVTQNVPKEPMYVIANLAVGGVWPGYPDSTTVFPAYYDIDYIRVYQR